MSGTIRQRKPTPSKKAKAGNSTPTGKKSTTPRQQETDRLLQAVFVLLIAAPFAAIAAGKWPSDADNLKVQLETGSFAKYYYLDSAWPVNQDKITSSEFFTTLALLSSPHVLYFFVWTNASIFKALFESVLFRWIGRPYQVFASLGYVFKIVQVIAFFVWYTEIDVEQVIHTKGTSLKELQYQTVIDTVVNRNTIVAISALELVILGLVLNFGVYRGLKEAGVYYGTRLGENVPWFFGFPFSVVSHPQYLGSAMIIQGMCILLATPYQVERGLYVIAVAMTLFYAFSSVVESKL